MDRRQQRQYFERLVQLREAYASRGDDDRVAVISIADATGLSLALVDGAESAPGSTGDVAGNVGSQPPAA